MDSASSYLKKIDTLVRQHPEYAAEAYHFVMTGLNFTLSQLKTHRHVSGQELSIGLKDYALDQYGPLAATVLEHWGIRETIDFGKIVFFLIDAGLMKKTADDSVDDFKEVYSFEECFGKGYDFLAYEHENDE